MVARLLDHLPQPPLALFPCEPLDDKVLADVGDALENADKVKPSPVLGVDRVEGASAAGG